MTSKLAVRLSLLTLLACALGTSARAHAPHDVVTSLAISPDFAQDRTVFASVLMSNRRLFARSEDGGRSWQAFAPPMVGHGIHAIVFSPAYAEDGQVFVGTGQGGIYRSTDRGLTWAPSNSGLTSVSVRDIAISPAFANDATLVLATSDGAFRSTDGGDTWAAENTGLTEPELKCAVWSSDGRVVYAGTQTLHVSFDKGLTWSPRSMLPSIMEDIVVSPLDEMGGTSAVCFGRLGGGVFASTDYGASYAPAVDGLTDAVVNELAFAHDGALYAATGSGGVFQSDMLFGPWSASLVGFEALSPLTGNHFTNVVVSPDHGSDDTLLCGAFEGVFLSEDRAQTWQQQEIYTQRLNRLLAFSPNYAVDGTFYVGNYGGAVFRHGPAASPADVSDGAGTTGPAAAPAAGLAPGATTATPAPPPSGLPPYDPASPWRPLGTGLALFSAVLAPSPTYGQDHTLFYGYVHLYRSTDRGRSWENVNAPQAIDVIRAIVLSPDFASDGTVFIGSGGEGVYRSGNHGDTWVEVSSNLPDDTHVTGLYTSPDYAEDRTVYLTSRQGLWRTTNDGGAWELLGLDFGEVRAFAVSPSYATDQTLFAGMAGEGLHISTDGGATWTPADTGISAGEDIIVEGIAVSPAFDLDGTLFLSTLTHGVLRSLDSGATWSDINEGLPLSAARQIALSPDFPVDRTVVHTNHDWAYISYDAGDDWSRLPGYVRVDESHQHVRLDGEWQLVTPNLESVVGQAVSDAGPECEQAIQDPEMLDALAALGISTGRPADLAALRRDDPVPDGPGQAGHHRPPLAAEPHGVTAFGLSSNYGLGSHVTSRPGDAATLSFFGDAVDVYAVRTPLSAMARIEIDGEVIGSIDLYAPEHRYQQRVFTKRFAELGWHTVRLIHTGIANPASGGSELHSDGFAYSF